MANDDAMSAELCTYLLTGSLYHGVTDAVNHDARYHVTQLPALECDVTSVYTARLRTVLTDGGQLAYPEKLSVSPRLPHELDRTSLCSAL